MTQDKRPAPVRPAATGVAATPRSGIETFLGDAARLKGAATGQAGRLVFALDATMSRQPTWDAAMRLQAEMFQAASQMGGLSVQLVYFRGLTECRASRFVADARALTDLMAQIDCRGGHTQIAKVLRHVREEDARQPVRAVIFVGDAMEEGIDELCALAGELALRNVRLFMFQEGHDPVAASAFAELARLTGGVHARFDVGAPGRLAELLRAAAAYAGGGVEGLKRLADREGGEARRWLALVGPKR